MDKILYFLAGAVLGWTITKHLIKSDNQLLKKILNQVIMSEQNLQEILQKLGLVKTSLTNIQTDITRIKENLPASGGLTEDEVATLRAELDTAVTQADTLDKENEPEVTPPTE